MRVYAVGLVVISIILDDRIESAALSRPTNRPRTRSLVRRTNQSTPSTRMQTLSIQITAHLLHRLEILLVMEVIRIEVKKKN